MAQLSQLKPGELGTVHLKMPKQKDISLVNYTTSFFSYDAEAWLDTPPDLQADEMTHEELSSMMCSIQVEAPSINK